MPFSYDGHKFEIENVKEQYGIRGLPKCWPSLKNIDRYERKKTAACKSKFNFQIIKQNVREKIEK